MRAISALRSASMDEVGFGGDIMDPRVATSFPASVKDALNELLHFWEQDSDENR